ncbi:putative kynurenine 3-monooxygenase [Nadsonia fulvescens var. elongata DSM 6958]|uniref:Kynurenine 3-monooxygenase n=1 Tax=Nadsonia fulvescens var. elongata DSM 6958 TaxID=857566 RepID=A0A1E3PNF7_9ASCO|nr:putative kynurenine 3-monooxygenase [Nadsonia fulvescens var. elongata DSM 6958]
MTKGTVAIVGAGLVGCVAALAFEKKGYKVLLFESRPDCRSPDQIAKYSFRSINLAVSARGIETLRFIDDKLAEKVLANVLPMHARMVHDLKGNQVSQDYGLNGEAINSIDRAYLNRLLLDEVDIKNNIKTYYNHKLVASDFEAEGGRVMLTFEHEGKPIIFEVDSLVGADGAYSTTRKHLQRNVRMNFSQDYIDHAYLELYIPPNPASVSNEDKWSISPNHLHIWPRHAFMLIALANLDGSFTSTMFAPWKCFEELDSDDKIIGFFEQNFPDALKLMGKDTILNSFHQNPRGSLVSTKCNPYNLAGKCIIIGDAAHSMVPFYGQGMNCGFEDVRVLINILEKNEFNIQQTYDEYSMTRNKDLLSIIDLSMNNYTEMRHSVVSNTYLLRKKIDGILARVFKNKWLPLYTMVSFRPDIMYSEAVRRETRQKAIVRSIVNLVQNSAIIGLVLIASRLTRSTIISKFLSKWFKR